MHIFFNVSEAQGASGQLPLLTSNVTPPVPPIFLLIHCPERAERIRERGDERLQWVLLPYLSFVPIRFPSKRYRYCIQLLLDPTALPPPSTRNPFFFILCG